MQALRILTNFGSFRKKILTMTQNSKKQITKIVSFGYSIELLSLTLLHNFEFSVEISKSKSIILTSYFNTLIFNFSRFKMNFGIVFENFSADR